MRGDPIKSHHVRDGIILVVVLVLLWVMVLAATAAVAIVIIHLGKAFVHGWNGT